MAAGPSKPEEGEEGVPRPEKARLDGEEGVGRLTAVGTGGRGRAGAPCPRGAEVRVPRDAGSSEAVADPTGALGEDKPVVTELAVREIGSGEDGIPERITGEGPPNGMVPRDKDTKITTITRNSTRPTLAILRCTGGMNLVKSQRL